MCVAATGKVVKIDKEIAEVDFNGNIVRAHTGIIDVKVGDDVLVHAGLIIQVMNKKDAEEMRKLFEELEEISK
ncbi:MAG: HypC/HybG/HupF family hydrogenase formation chaperone [Clostridia bacterium]|nr:HypC/HybG/HupF family hydrogenase formation chaperone [Clostridia bacterium]